MQAVTIKPMRFSCVIVATVEVSYPQVITMRLMRFSYIIALLRESYDCTGSKPLPAVRWS